MNQVESMLFGALSVIFNNISIHVVIFSGLPVNDNLVIFSRTHCFATGYPVKSLMQTSIKASLLYNSAMRFSFIISG